MDNKTYATPFAPIDPSKGLLATQARALALNIAAQRTPSGVSDSTLMKIAADLAAYILGERAEEAAPAAAEFSGFGPTVAARKDSAGRIFVWDEYACTHREVVYK